MNYLPGLRWLHFSCWFDWYEASGRSEWGLWIRRSSSYCGNVMKSVAAECGDILIFTLGSKPWNPKKNTLPSYYFCYLWSSFRSFFIFYPSFPADAASPHRELVFFCSASWSWLVDFETRLERPGMSTQCFSLTLLVAEKTIFKYFFCFKLKSLFYLTHFNFK